MIAYSLTANAREELREILAYSRRRWSEQQATAYLEGFFRIFQQIGLGAAKSHSITDGGVEARRTTYKSHFIYWRQLASGKADIVTVLHQRMAQEDRVRVAFKTDRGAGDLATK